MSLISDCCGVVEHGDNTGLCGDCKEPCEFWDNEDEDEEED